MGRDATAHLFFGYLLDEDHPLHGQYCEARDRDDVCPLFGDGPVVVGGMHDSGRVYYVALRAVSWRADWGPRPIAMANAPSQKALDAAILAAGLPKPNGEPRWYLGAELF